MKTGYNLFIGGNGYGHGFYISNEGELYGFGHNSSGKLGLSHSSPCIKPTQIRMFKNKILKVALGHGFSLFLTKELLVYSAGYNNQGQLGVGDKKNRSIPTLIKLKNVTDTFGMIYHSFFFVGDEIYACGYNVDGQLGIGSEDKNKTKFLPVRVKINEKMKCVDGGKYFTFMLSKNNLLYSAGKIGEYKSSIFTLRYEKVLKITSGEFHFMALTESKKLIGVGTNGNFQMGILKDGRYSEWTELEELSTPQNENENEEIIDVKSGNFHSVVLFKSGKAIGLGDSSKYGKSNQLDGITKVGVFLMDDIIQIEVGRYQTFLLKHGKESLEIWCAGDNYSGQLALGIKENISNVIMKNELIKDVKYVRSGTIESVKVFRVKLLNEKERFIDIKIVVN